ncbi:unnamed protein product [Cunninghamella blakesleeana]
MFFHGWNNYLENAFPEMSYDSSNDVLGDYSLTLVDTLDTLAIIGTKEQFEHAVNQVLEYVSFDKNNKVQVFELNIRALGGLLSAHIFASDPTLGRKIENYDGGLLKLAVDLAQRFIPAFVESKTGIPYPRVNLRHGVPKTETVQTCTAGAGSLILEFGVLSRLTGDPIYEQLAKKALISLWERRSDLNLVGNVIDIQTGKWIHTASSTGAGIDSFFEYLLKAYILFGEKDYLEIFEQSYEAILKHIVDKSGYLYRNVHMDSGTLMATWIDSLSSFMPGVQVLYGDLEAAIKGHLVFYNLWRRYHAIPERFDFYHKTANVLNYPLRPEFVESNYYLYQATKDPFYLHVGEMILEDLNNRTRIPCGFASMHDVQTGRLEDRMESFMLSETLKYLYLLFDSENSINTMDSNFVFTTEGHILPLANQYLKSVTVKGSSGTSSSPLMNNRCKKYNPFHFSKSTMNKTSSVSAFNKYMKRSKSFTGQPRAFDLSSVPYLPLFDFASYLTRFEEKNSPISTYNANVFLHRQGTCFAPKLRSKSFTLTFGQDYRKSYQQASPKFVEILGGFLYKSLSGLKMELTDLPRNLGGGYSVTAGESEKIIVPIDAIKSFLKQDQLELYEETLPSSWSDYIGLEYRTIKQDEIDGEIELRLLGKDQSKLYTAVESNFGGSFLKDTINDDSGDEEEDIYDVDKTSFNQEDQEYRVIHFLGDDRLFGCEEYNTIDAEKIKGKILITSRGKCTFYTKVRWAEKAGANGVLFINNEEKASAFKAMSEYNGNSPYHKVTIPSATMTRESGAQLLDFLNLYDTTRMTFNKPTKETSLISSTLSGVKINGKFVNNWIVIHS